MSWTSMVQLSPTPLYPAQRSFSFSLGLLTHRLISRYFCLGLPVLKASKSVSKESSGFASHWQLRVLLKRRLLPASDYFYICELPLSL